MTMGEYIKQLRTARGMSQEELGKLCGVNRAAVNKWETGLTENIKRSVIKTLSEVFQVSPAELLCISEPKAAPGKIPLLGTASCGSGASAAILTDIDCPPWVSADCAFQCIGNSMESYGIHNGDIIFIHSGRVPDEGIGCVRIGNDYYVKVIEYAGNMVALKSDLKTIFISGEQEDAEIIGRAVFQYHEI